MKTTKTEYPLVIQGGMGVWISDWFLARIVSMLGGLGTISGVMLERVIANILQDGDPGGHIRRALATFPFQKYVKGILEKYFIEGGKKKGAKYKNVPSYTVNPPESLIALTICAVYSFVWLAKEGHKNPISINFLEKVAMPHLYAIVGAMLAGVDFITVGAGLPSQFPKVMDDILKGETAEYTIPVKGDNIKKWTMRFNPEAFFGAKLPPMEKPKFLPIISSNLLADMLVNMVGKEDIYGFVVELDSAGGHNAKKKRPIDYAKLAEHGIPFWIGGATASPEMLQWALSVGAKGIQAGSIFALSEDSHMDPNLRNRVRKLGFNKFRLDSCLDFVKRQIWIPGFIKIFTGSILVRCFKTLKVRTDSKISPTTFLFEVACLSGTLSEQDIYDSRKRVCNIGGLVSLYEKPNGDIGYMCSAEPEESYLSKGGDLKETICRGCLCNGLFATCGLGNPIEPPIVTLGIYFGFLKKLMKHKNDRYWAEDAMRYILN